MKKLISLFILLAILIAGCESPAEKQAEAERKQQQSAVVEEARIRAVNNFLERNYKGWQYKGVSGDLALCEDDEDELCRILIANNQEEKVLAILLKNFEVQNGETVLIAYEPNSAELNKIKDDDLKRLADEYEPSN